MVQGKWTAYPPIPGKSAPVARNAHAQAGIKDDVWLFGGRQGIEVGEAALADLWKWKTKTKEWVEMKDAGGDGPPEPRSYHACASLEDKFYVFGGCGSDGRLADLHEFNTTTNEWKRLPDPPSLAGRGGATLEAIPDGDGDGDGSGAGTIFLFSGFEGKESRDLLTLNLATKQWTVHPKPSLVTERSVCASFALPGRMVVFGGEVNPSDKGHDGAGAFSKEVFAFDPMGGVSALAVKQEEGPVERGWADAAALGDFSGFIYGGLTGSDADPKRLGDAWVLFIDEVDT